MQLLKKNQQSMTISGSLNNKIIDAATKEILKLFAKQIPSLKKLVVRVGDQFQHQLLRFVSYPEAKDCLKNLS